MRQLFELFNHNAVGLAVCRSVCRCWDFGFGSYLIHFIIIVIVLVAAEEIAMVIGLQTEYAEVAKTKHNL